MSCLPEPRKAQLPDCPRGSGAARVLLQWSIWTVVSLSTACILPVAPEFQDPPKAPNYAPFFVSFDPFAETPVTQVPLTFSVLLADPNPQDTLHVRWAADYPPFVQTRSRLLVDEQTIMPGAVPQASYPLPALDSCKVFASGGDHRLVVIVSDRPFRKVDTFTGVYRFNLVEGGEPPIMAGWTVPGCP
jgi:hypothetical protein